MLPIQATQAEEYSDISEEFREKMERQIPALQAHELLYTLFTLNPDGTVTYTDDFAGAWIEDFKYLHIATTSNPNARGFVYGAILQDFSDIVVFQEATNSLNDLMQIRRFATDLLRDAGLPIVYSCIDVMTGTINLGFSELDEGLIRGMLFENETASSRAIPMNLPEDLFVLNLEEMSVQNQSTALRGGMPIRSDGVIGPSRTIGVNLTLNRFITAGHNLAAGTRMFHSMREVGMVSQISYHNGANGDWAVVTITNRDFSQTNTVLGGPSGVNRRIVGTVLNVAPGTLIHAFGAESRYAMATVNQQNREYLSDSGFWIHGITIATLVNGTTARGDSGSPWHVYAGSNTWLFAGIHGAANTHVGGSSVFFTPYVRFSWLPVLTN
ncbi:MAG: S1 family peptidase [Defluviitaleaceae bacterium]|nr:S1 family peptidase [Defluviitaleaceae bacterium]